MGWILLAGAIVLELIATTCLKLSNGMTRPRHHKEPQPKNRSAEALDY
jgi:multidrug transporter EmrE-like cation transporter